MLNTNDINNSVVPNGIKYLLDTIWYVTYNYKCRQYNICNKLINPKTLLWMIHPPKEVCLGYKVSKTQNGSCIWNNS